LGGYKVDVKLDVGQATYEKVNEELFFDKPLHVIMNKRKLAYRIYVILIANKEFKKMDVRGMRTKKVKYHCPRRQIC
jgi:hypothetical protein